MSERYTRLFALPGDLYAEGSPVVLAAGALLKDNETGRVLAQLKIKNINSKTIKAAKVRVTPFDTVGKPLGEKTDYQYLDLNIGRDKEFGQKVAIELPDASTRSFSAAVTEVDFEDNSVWTPSGTEWEPLPKQTELAGWLNDAELEKQYQFKYGKDCKYAPLELKDLWLCPCGEINRQGETSCHLCDKSLSDLKAADLEQLKAGRDARLAAEAQKREEERQERERIAAEAKAAAEARAKKAKKIMAILLPIIILVIVSAAMISNKQKSDAYNEACLSLAAEDFEEAIAVFTELGDYKDSAEQLQYAKETKQLAENYEAALSMLDQREYQRAFSAFNELGTYKDSAEILSKFQILRTSKEYFGYMITNGKKQEPGSHYHVDYNYDPSGRLVSEEVGEIEYIYDPYGKLVTAEKGDDYKYYIEYSYDDEGRMIKEVKYTKWSDSKNQYDSVTTTEYDIFGNTLSITTEKISEGTVTYTDYKNTIAENGHLEKQTRVLEYYVDFVRTEESSYDSEGKELKRILTDTYRDGSKVIETLYEFTYDSHGNQKEIAFTSKDDARLNGRKTVVNNTYDGKGNLLSQESILATGNERNYHIYTYDENSNMLTHIFQNGNHISLSEEIYTYEYVYTPDAA